MASVTALELVNRVRLFRRQPETTVIATPEDVVTLNAINIAIEDVLSIRKWEFDLRTDGQLELRGQLDDCTIEISAGTSQANLTRSSLVATDVFGDYAVRVRLDGDTTHANTAMRVNNSSAIIFGTVSVLALESKIRAGVAALTDCTVFYSEYILPDTVSSVVRASYQETPLTLEQVDPTVRYNEIFPRPHDEFGPPKVIAVGGFDTKTFVTTAPLVTPAPGLRLAVWPIPDLDYTIHYSYYYKHPELVLATDLLDGVPTNVVNDIVLQATSIVMMTWDQNYAAAHFTDLSREQAAAKHSAYGGSKARRHRIDSFENGSGQIRLQPGFPGKLIG